MPVFSISGNAGAAGVTVTLSGFASGSTTSAADGSYTLGGLAAGAYTVTPTLAGAIFTPVSQNETIVATDITDVNFVAQAASFSNSPTVSDDFHRADSSDLGPNWTPVTDSNTPITILSNLAVVGATVPEGSEIYIGSGFANNQYAAITVEAFGLSSFLIINVRNNVQDTNGYSAFLKGNGDGSYTILLFDNTTGPIGVSVTLGGAPQSGDVLAVQAVGTLITAFYNNIPISSATNSATASGSPSLEIVSTAIQTDTAVSLFVAGPTQSSPSGTGMNSDDTGAITSGEVMASGPSFATQMNSRRTSIIGTNLGTKIIH